MKLKEAIELGKSCGIETIEESINNVLFHSGQLFPYDKISENVSELKEEAKSVGIRFCQKCSYAILNEKCHFCQGD